MPDRAVDRRQRDHHLHRRAVRVGDDPAVGVERLGIDLGDHQRHLGVHAPEARVVDHHRAGLDQLRRPLGADRAARRREDQVEALDRLARERPALELPAVEARPSAPPSARRRRRPPRSRGSRARRAPRASSSRPPRWRRGRRPCSRQASSRGLVLVLAGPTTGPVLARSAPRGGPRPRRARTPGAAPAPPPGPRSAAITQEILIGEVEIISMLIPFSPSVWKTFAATPGWLRIPAPTIETLPIRSSVSSRSQISSALERLGRGSQVVAGRP